MFSMQRARVWTKDSVFTSSPKKILLNCLLGLIFLLPNLTPATADVSQLNGFADTLAPALRSVVRVEALSGPAANGGTPVSVGSGVVFDASAGLILTNSHVVSNSDNFRIQVFDGRWIDAELLGADAPTDIAVLRSTESGLEQVAIADSDLVRVGDLAFAAGYPLGLDRTLTMGIISGLGRSGNASSLTDFLQTDAAVNSGNSGGPLLDAEGRLVGINTAILSRSGGNLGIAFAIPSRIAVEVAAQLSAFGEIRHGGIGVALGKVTQEASAKAGTDNWDGALIVSVDPASPAKEAGLRPDDVVTAFNGRHVRSPNALRTYIGISGVGTPIKLLVMRAGDAKEFSLATRAVEDLRVESMEQLGVHAREVSNGTLLPEGVSGLVVEKIERGSAVEAAGLLVDDVILAMNDEPVETLHLCDRIVSEANGRVRFIVFRGGVIRPIVVNAT